MAESIALARPDLAPQTEHTATSGFEIQTSQVMRFMLEGLIHQLSDPPSRPPNGGEPGLAIITQDVANRPGRRAGLDAKVAWNCFIKSDMVSLFSSLITQPMAAVVAIETAKGACLDIALCSKVVYLMRPNLNRGGREGGRIAKVLKTSARFHAGMGDILS